MSLKIALFGYGKMGKMVEQLAPTRGHTIDSISTFPVIISQSSDVIIDFSAADAVLEHVIQAGKAKKNIVIGTTGWEKHLNEVKELVSKYQIGALYAPNFSIGVHLFLKLVKEAGHLFANYSAAGLEIHHSEKKDAPSGTALALSEVLEKKPEFASIRLGNIPGTHTLYFDSIEDTITLTHTAKGREGFALGAIIAAEWLKTKKGFFTLEDIL